VKYRALWNGQKNSLGKAVAQTGSSPRRTAGHLNPLESICSPAADAFAPLPGNWIQQIRGVKNPQGLGWSSSVAARRIRSSQDAELIAEIMCAHSHVRHRIWQSAVERGSTKGRHWRSASNAAPKVADPTQRRAAASIPRPAPRRYLACGEVLEGAEPITAGSRLIPGQKPKM